jgi:stage V sporulation protein D (sporulation-specific penicillin-binding protein)
MAVKRRQASRSNPPVRRRRRASRKTKKFTVKMQKKLLVFFGMICVAFIGLVFRLVSITRNNGTEYSMAVLSQQSYENQTLPYKRGKITDANGTILADSTMVYNVIIDSKVIGEQPFYMEPTLAAAEYLGLDKEKIRTYVIEHPTSQYYIARKRVPYKDKLAYDDWVSKGIEEENTKKGLLEQNKFFNNIKGIWFEQNYIRTYPSGALASDVIGFANNSNVGAYGLEEYYNDVLNGVEGRTYGYLDEARNLETTTVEARDGDNLVLTLDGNLQAIVMKYLEAFGEQYRDNAHEGNGANNIGCIIMDVNTADVLAMGSYPGYDLTDPYDTDRLVGMPKLSEIDEATDEYLTKEDVDALSEKDQTRYLNALWRNYCITDYYEPGSVIKPFTVATGLETGTVSPDDTFECEGKLHVADQWIKCHNIYGDGTLTVAEAVERSCNVALMYMADQIGNKLFSQYQKTFNFGLKTNIDLAGEAKTDNMVQAPDMGPVDLATNSFGQNFNVTMIQTITGFCSLVNGGIYYEPHIVSKITSSSGATVQTRQPRILKRTISEETSEMIRDYMVRVVEGKNGTGHSSRPAGYRIGGKTGTAETLPRGNNEYVTSFMGFAPVDNPQIAIYVVVDRPNVEEQDTARYACVLAKDILQEALPYLHIYMTEDLSDREKQELEEKGLRDTNGLGD